ncbi:hypothetical protein WN48_07599 [Eufriesea mexicana]|uniref:Uncharacterized protein n=1 Tax=Eufriesea mexicana TaxID=516756 RepID=A0A310SMR9_9HYME|nr:hypothetical protein WN48_07599 [Eufriesea mexicana]
MDQEKKSDTVNLKSNISTTPASPTLSTPPTLNLMEQLLLAKIEKQNLHEDNCEPDARVGEKKRNFLLRRTDSMDSQTSVSTYNSFLSSDSTSSGNLYCKCDDCLLGIVDNYQRSLSVVGRKKRRILSRRRILKIVKVPLKNFEDGITISKDKKKYDKLKIRLSKKILYFPGMRKVHNFEEAQNRSEDCETNLLDVPEQNLKLGSSFEEDSPKN